MDRNSFSLTEASDIVSIKRRTLAFYADSLLVHPEISPASGRGTKRLFSRLNLLEFLVVRELNDRGVRLENMQTAISAFSAYRYDYDEIGSILLVIENPNSIDDCRIRCEGSTPPVENITLPIKNDRLFIDAILIINVTNLWQKIKNKL